MRRATLFLILALFFVYALIPMPDVPGVTSTGTIYIRADGSVDPPTAPIHQDGDIYTLTSNITFDMQTYSDGIVIQRSSITLDGANHTLTWMMGCGAAGIRLQDRANVTIKNVNIAGCFDHCIILSNCSNNILVDNHLIAAALELLVIVGSNNTVSRNTLGESWHSDCKSFRLHGSDNGVVQNTMASFDLNTVGLRSTMHNNITENKIGEIRIGEASNNSIHHNNIGMVDNSEFISGVNFWDDGYPSGGNYWGDYAGIDEYSGVNQNEAGRDGIGDTQYVIDESNQDNYPLMKPYGGVFDTGILHVSNSKREGFPHPTVGRGFSLNITVEMLNYGATTTNFNITVWANTTAISCMECSLAPRAPTNITFPGVIMDEVVYGNYSIWANSTVVPSEIDVADNFLTDGWIFVTIPGDVNGDRAVDIFDAIHLAGTICHASLNPNADINNDGMINIFDAIILAGHFGESW